MINRSHRHFGRLRAADAGGPGAEGIGPGVPVNPARGGPPGPNGAAAVDFALVLPLFLVLLFGVVEFGLIMYAKGIITQASREGARWGVVYSLTPRTQDEIQTHVQDYLQGAGFTGAQVIASPGDPLSVKVVYPYRFTVLPDFISGLTGELDLSAETIMRME